MPIQFMQVAQLFKKIKLMNIQKVSTFSLIIRAE